MTDDTQNPGGWPDAARPGYPQNPEHRWCHAFEVGDDVWLSQWEPHDDVWDFGNTGAIVPAAEFGAHCVAEGYRYLGPCLTPAEVAAREATARREGIEALAAKFERMTDHATAALVRSVGSALLEDAPRISCTVPGVAQAIAGASQEVATEKASLRRVLLEDGR